LLKNIRRQIYSDYRYITIYTRYHIINMINKKEYFKSYKKLNEKKIYIYVVK